MRILAAMGVQAGPARIRRAHLSMEPDELATLSIEVVAHGDDVQELADACREAGLFVKIQPVVFVIGKVNELSGLPEAAA
jgi:hypothetical protein